MSTAIIIKKVEKEGIPFIGVELPYEPDLIEKIKQIKGREWDMGLRCWLVPYSKETYARLKDLFGTLQVHETTTGSTQASSQARRAVEKVLSKVKMALTPKRIMLQLPKNDTDLAFIRSLQHARWDKNTFSWIITPTVQNQELIKRFFGDRLELITLTSPALEIQQPDSVVPAVPAPIIEKNKLLIVHYVVCTR